MKPLFLAFAISAGCVTAGAFYAATVQKGVQIERARVQAKGKTTNETVQKRQRAAAATPANRVLDKWSTD